MSSKNHSIPFTDILTDRLLLKKLTLDDAVFLFGYRSKPEVTKFQSWEPADLKEVEQFIETQFDLPLNKPGSWFQLAIYLKKTDEMIGDCVIHFLENDHSQAEIGYTIAPQFQGNGFATEAVNALLHFLFTHLKKHRVMASVDPENVYSIKLLQRVGMRKEAHFKKSLWIKNKWYDDVIYAILQEEWQSES